MHTSNYRLFEPNDNNDSHDCAIKQLTRLMRDRLARVSREKIIRFTFSMKTGIFPIVLPTLYFSSRTVTDNKTEKTSSFKGEEK